MIFDFCLNLLKNLPHLLSQLSHDGVDPGEACGGVRPLGERVVVVVPRDLGKIFLSSIFSFVFYWLLPHGIWPCLFILSLFLFVFYWMLSQWINNSLIKHLDTDGVSSHLVKVWILSCCAVEEFSPEQLPVEGERGLTFLYFPAGSCITWWWEWFLTTCRDLWGRDKINENDSSQPVEICEGVIKQMRMIPHNLKRSERVWEWDLKGYDRTNENGSSQSLGIWEGVIKQMRMILHNL